MSEYQKAKGISWTKMNERLVILDTREQRVFHEFDEIATLLWDAIDTFKNFDDLVVYMTEVFDVELEVAKQDALYFIQDLKAKRLID